MKNEVELRSMKRVFFTRNSMCAFRFMRARRALHGERSEPLHVCEANASLTGLFVYNIAFNLNPEKYIYYGLCNRSRWESTAFGACEVENLLLFEFTLRSKAHE